MAFSNRVSVRGALRLGVAVSGLALAMAGSGTAFAQDAGDNGDEEIVVTGTLIRGTEVVGAQTIAVDAEVIQQQGANSTNQILSLIPQVSNTFNGRFEGDPRGIGAGISINKPNLRNLPGFNSASGGVTLVLVDGFRIAPIGVNQAAIDVDIIPGQVLSGVDALTDGGTSLYGADAVAGVLNFRTMRSYEGLKLDVNYGFGDTISGFQQYDGSITAGTSWSSGNAYISASYAHRDAIYNRDVPWTTGEIFDAAGNPSFVGRQCPSPVGATNTFVYLAIPGVFTGWTDNPGAGGGVNAVGTTCDDSSDGTYLPKQERYNVFGAVSQELGDNLDLRVTGYYTKRDVEIPQIARGFTTAAATPVFPDNPIPFVSRLTVDAGTSFSFSPNAAYQSLPQEVGFETWGISPELTVALPSEYQLRVSMHYGQSDNYQSFPGVNAVLAQQLVNSGALDPFNVAAASAATIESVTDYVAAQDTTHKLFATRAVVDGPLFSLPGGDARIAVGAEFQNNKAKTRANSGPFGALNSQAFRSTSRDAYAVFGELSMPVTEWLDLNGSLRYDHYSDFGSTTNPNIGIAFKPVEGFKIYGHWTTSFNAPTALDALAVSLGRSTPPIYAPGRGPQDPLNRWDGTGTRAVILEGSNPGLKPQTADSWAIGVELKPTDGLKLGGQFYSIKFKNILGAVNPANPNTYSTDPQFYYYNPTQAEWDQFISELANGADLAAQVNREDVALLVDRRTSNLSSAKIEGVDFNAFYNIPTSYGSLSFGVNGNVPTKLDVNTSGTIVNQIPLAPDYTASLFGAVNAGGFSGRLTVNVSGGIDDNGPDNTGTVFASSSFVQANLFLGYSFDEDSGALAGTSFRVIIDNLLEEKPQRVMRANSSLLPYVNWTLGRVIKLGITKEF
ncbi:MAG: TonB-dependent receptor [Sphingomonadaceae bacterium]